MFSAPLLLTRRSVAGTAGAKPPGDSRTYGEAGSNFFRDVPEDAVCQLTLHCRTDEAYKLLPGCGGFDNPRGAL